MPYENEHACRLQNPDKYNQFRRVNNDIEVGGKKADAIYGINGDTAELQAVRFKTDKFTENEAHNWCRNHNGTFEPASNNEGNKMKNTQDKIFKNKAVPTHTPDMLDDESWDGDNAVDNLRQWASNDGSGDKETIDWDDYKYGFGWYNDNEPENFTSYKLPHHKVVNGELRTSKQGVYAAAAAVEGARGGIDISDSQLADVRDHLETHYSQMDEDPPWREMQDEYVCECLECGHIVESEEHCKDIKCPECGGQMRRLERPGEGRHEQTDNFYLLKHWWKGQFVVKWGPSKEHWDLFYNGKQIVLDSNPLESNEMGTAIREPYTNDFEKKGSNGPEYIEPGTPGNPTKDTSCWVERLDEGTINVEIDTETKKVFSINGENLTDTWVLEREDENTNLWVMKKQEQHSELQQHELSCDTPVEIELMEMLPTGNMKIEGCILGEGVWNGYFWPGDVVKEVGEEAIENLKIEVGPDHEDKITDAGEVINYQWDDHKKGWHIEAIIDNKEAIERAQSLEDPGWSIEATAYSDNVRNIIKEITDLKSAVLVRVPACKTCYVS